MSKEEIEQKLAKLMDTVPECEGLIAADIEGNVIVGQTITEMDHAAIAKSVAAIIKDSNLLGKNTGKGALKSTTIELENGFAVLVGSEDKVFIALAGEDGKASLGLLKRNLTKIAQ
ncbi:MAG: roadblock/LC7 domain-containing protein [Promethearchaeia archaeon]